MRLVVLVLAMSLVLGGCGGEGDEAALTGTATTAPPGTTEPERRAECESEDGYSVEYPADWYQERCAYFHREPFEVPRATEFFDVAVLVSREPVSLEVAAAEDRTRTIVERSETEIGGREAVRLEAQATGEGLLDRGIRFYQVLISADGDTVFLSSYDLPGLDYERNKEAVDEIADGLRLTD